MSTFNLVLPMPKKKSKYKDSYGWPNPFHWFLDLYCVCKLVGYIWVSTSYVLDNVHLIYICSTCYLFKCELVTQLIFPFEIIFIIQFQWKNYSKFNIFSTLSLKKFKSLSLILIIESFQYPRACTNPYNFEFWISNDKVLNIKYFSTIGWNIMKPTQCTPTHGGHCNGIKSMARGVVIWEISMLQTKQVQINYLPSDRCGLNCNEY